MKRKRDYAPPEVGTVFMLRSQYSGDPRLEHIKGIASFLEKEGLISESMKPAGYTDVLRIRLNKYLHSYPTRKHNKHWIDGGKQVAVFHPETGLPFFLNNSGSKIGKICDGRHSVFELIESVRREWALMENEVLVRDLMKFLLLLEELDLIEFKGCCH